MPPTLAGMCGGTLPLRVLLCFSGSLLLSMIAAAKAMPIDDQKIGDCDMHDDNQDERKAGRKGEVVRLADLVEYQGGSIVSREVLKKDTGTVTLFAFDEGQGLSEHTAPFDALVHILDGEAQITISGTTHSPKAGEMIIMPANEPHAVQAAKRFKMLLVMIRS